MLIARSHRLLAKILLLSGLGLMVSVATTVATPESAYAAGETYRYGNSARATLFVTGGNTSYFVDTTLSPTLDPDYHDSYIDACNDDVCVYIGEFEIRSQHDVALCGEERDIAQNFFSGKIELTITVNASGQPYVASLYFGCLTNAGSVTHEAIFGSQWDSGSLSAAPVIMPDGDDSDSGTSIPDREIPCTSTGGRWTEIDQQFYCLERYEFSNADGTEITGCGGLFVQFSGNCLTFSFEPPSVIGRNVTLMHGSETLLNEDLYWQAVNVSARDGCVMSFAMASLEANSRPDLVAFAGASALGQSCPAFNLGHLFFSGGATHQITIEEGALAETEDDAQWASTCNPPYMGWLICGVTKAIGWMIDGAYGAVSIMLRTPPLTADSDIYAAWSAVRNIANIAFVIVFLVIIYSQLTSMGISNYGIKRMMPRLIVAAVLVNISYWVCAVAVDVSNILGSSMRTFITDDLPAAGQIYPGAGENVTVEGETSGYTWEGIAVMAVAGIGIAVGIALGLFGPIAIAALAAIFAVLAVLVMRQALIILLIIVAPLALVAYLLPNTEQWYKRWVKLFGVLLMLYPIIAVIFGASQVASNVVINSSTNLLVIIMGMGIAVVPLFITPVVMKFAGGVLNRFAGVVNDKDRGVFDRMKKRTGESQEARRNQIDAQALAGKGGLRARMRSSTARRGARRKLGRTANEQNLKIQEAGYGADYLQGKDGSGGEAVSLLEKARAKATGADARTNADRQLDNMSGGLGDEARRSALANAITVEAEINAKEVKAAQAVIDNANLPSDMLNRLAKGEAITTADGTQFSGGDEALRRAAIQMALPKATVSDVEDLIKSSGSMTVAQRQELSEGIAKNGIHNKATHLGGATLDKIAQGQVTSEEDLNEAVAYHFNKGKFGSAENLVNQDGKTLERVYSVAAAGTTAAGTTIDVTQTTLASDAATKALSDPRLNVRISSAEARQGIQRIDTL